MIPLQYTRCPSAGIDNDNDQWESDEDDPFHILCMQWMKICHLQEQLLLCAEDLFQGNLLPSPSFSYIEPFITYEKRRRSSNWEPPEHIPDFLHFQSTQSLLTFSPIAINTGSLYFDAYIIFFFLSSFLILFSDHFLALFESHFFSVSFSTFSLRNPHPVQLNHIQHWHWSCFVYAINSF